MGYQSINSTLNHSATDVNSGLENALARLAKAVGKDTATENARSFKQFNEDCSRKTSPCATQKTENSTWKPLYRGTIPGSIRRFGPRKITSRDVSAAIRRRRMLSGDCHLAPESRQKYTQGESACARIVAGEVARHGHCDLSKKEIADRAGVRYTTVSNWLRKAALLGDVACEWRDAAGRRYKS